MNKNAVLIASIMFVAGCAANDDYSTAQNGPGIEMADLALTRGTENVVRTPSGEMIAPSDPSLSTQADSPFERSDPSRYSDSLFHNNRSHAAGSAAASETGFANGGTVEVPDYQLARQVKFTLVKETTRAADMTQREVARNLQVTSRNGNIVLKGTVPTQKAKDVMEIRVREIAGVHRVENRLTVSPPSESRMRDVNQGHNLDEVTSQLHTLDRFKD